MKTLKENWCDHKSGYCPHIKVLTWDTVEMERDRMLALEGFYACMQKLLKEKGVNIGGDE